MLHRIMTHVLTWLLDDLSLNGTSVGHARSASRLMACCRNLAACWDARWAMQSLQVEFLEGRPQGLINQGVPNPPRAAPSNADFSREFNLERLMRTPRRDLWDLFMEALRRTEPEQLRMQLYRVVLALSPF